MSLKFNKIESEDGSVRFGNKEKRLKKNALKILKGSAMYMNPTVSQSLEESVKKSAAEMKQVELEKKVLKYQTMTPGQKVNQFLLQKYTDSHNMAVAMIDLYDNSEERINSGINYEYHVYLPEVEEYNPLRIENKYVVSEKINDYKIGDVYYYHIPIYLDSTEIKTDFGEIIGKNGSSESKDGLLYALSKLSKNLKDNNFLLNDEVFKILQSHNFIDQNKKLVLGIVGGMKIEKYLLDIKPAKRLTAIEYLNSKEGVIDERADKDYEELKAKYQEKVAEIEKLKKEKDQEVEKLEKEKKKVEEKKKKSEEAIKKIQNNPKVKEETKEKVIANINKLEKESEKIEEKIEKVEEKIDEEIAKKTNEVKKEVETETTTTTTTTNFVFDDTINLVENLVANKYKPLKFVRNGIGTSEFSVEPLILIDHINKKFYCIVDKAGKPGVLTKGELIENNKKRHDQYINDIKNNIFNEIPLNDSEKNYLRAREIIITPESPIELVKSKQFVVADLDIQNKLKNYYKK